MLPFLHLSSYHLIRTSNISTQNAPLPAASGCGPGTPAKAQRLSPVTVTLTWCPLDVPPGKGAVRASC